MDTEQALFRRVLADPRSDAPRVAFADAIEPSDPDRAEHIRVQLEYVRRLREGGPERERWPLQDRARQLEDRHWDAWTASVAELAHALEFKRGFIESVTIDASAFLRHAPALFDRAPILDLRTLRLKSVAAALFASPYLGRLRSLDLSQEGLGDDEVRALAASPYVRTLRWLDLSQNLIRRAGLEALAASPNLPELRWLAFDGNVADSPVPVADVDGEFVQQVRVSPIRDELEAKYGRRAWMYPPSVYPRPTPEEL